MAQERGVGAEAGRVRRWPARLGSHRMVFGAFASRLPMFADQAGMPQVEECGLEQGDIALEGRLRNLQAARQI